ncbi:hypothetical protein [Cyclobacterium xiamenense]|jgi:hypothetical protein|uniref:hypothetical protein n=1 Tax=Cyclobacterium xiamenense TaxID=1297121 RepID=UPI001F514C2B|nr:hypothetical protein [Cyclobacterium xiamenense]
MPFIHVEFVFIGVHEIRFAPFLRLCNFPLIWMGARSHFRLPAAGSDKPESSWAFYSLVDELEKCAVAYFIEEPVEVNIHYVLIAMLPAGGLPDTLHYRDSLFAKNVSR